MSSPFEKESQQQAIALVHSASGLLSTIGSSLIFSSVMVLRRKQPLSSFQRLLLGLSTYDLLHSLAVTATTLPVRSDADVWGASGTVATCTAQGILQQQAQAGFWYNAAMAIYFLAVIRYSVKDRTIQRYEKVFHVVTFVFLEIVAITPAFYGAYNPMWFSELGCWFGPWPIGCVGDECERGQHFFYLGIFCAIIFQVATFAIISVCNILIFRTFRKQENQMRRYQSGGDRRLSREIAIQGFLYSGAALNTVFWGFLSLIMGTIENISEEALLFFSLMNAFMFPIQGFFNFIIYVRPRYIRARKHRASECLGVFAILHAALYEEGRLSTERNGNGTNMTTTSAVQDVEVVLEEQSPAGQDDMTIDDLTMDKHVSVKGNGDAGESFSRHFSHT